MNEMRFTKRVRVEGNLGSNFVFSGDKEVEDWKKYELPKLELQYGPLTISVSDLPGLGIGDTCYVWGEGDREFTIKNLIRYSPNRYGFVLDSGWSEEVAKCYTL